MVVGNGDRQLCAVSGNWWRVDCCSPSVGVSTDPPNDLLVERVFRSTHNVVGFYVPPLTWKHNGSKMTAQQYYCYYYYYYYYYYLYGNLGLKPKPRPSP